MLSPIAYGTIVASEPSGPVTPGRPYHHNTPRSSVVQNHPELVSSESVVSHQVSITLQFCDIFCVSSFTISLNNVLWDL
jgi:hypothetical protein